MPGVVFLVVIPTANYEQSLPNPLLLRNEAPNSNKPLNTDATQKAVRLEVELRSKNITAARNQFRQAEPKRRPNFIGGSGGGIIDATGPPPPTYDSHRQNDPQGGGGGGSSMENLLQQLLLKLDIQHVVWSTAKGGHHHHVVFPLQAGDPCETTLHCLTELRIGRMHGTSVSVLPCSVNYDALQLGDEDELGCEISSADMSKWNAFVDTIKSKLTVKQVVDGVRSGGALSFDYLLLIVTADSLAALGLVENNAPNITAAMLVSPLMGPVMSITFGAIISDLQLVKSGLVSLTLGMLISLLFGLCFGLILGSTEMPWGFGDWPTEEMKGRGNARALWMGVLWALTSGTGVAVALLQGSVGPLIGVAISASLLPPVVNCGLYWSLSCTWLLKTRQGGNFTLPGTKIPHLKGEPFHGNHSAYEPLYSDYMPVEFFVNGIVSCMLTVINVICIFITAIIVLKIKEVAAPYTASPDLRRFWETDIQTVRRSNRSTIRRNWSMRGSRRVAGRGKHDPLEMMETNQVFDKPNELPSAPFGEALANALKQLAEDPTYRQVRRMSFSANAADPVANTGGPSAAIQQSASADSGSGAESLRSSAGMAHDLQAMEQLLAAMSKRQKRLVGIQSDQSPMRRSNSGVRMPTIMEKIVKRRSLGAADETGGGSGNGGGSGRRHRHGVNEETVNLTQNVLD